jgi:Family of unknown function (DUF6152)
MRRIVLPVIAATLLACTAAYAHHSYASTYDVSKQVNLKGKVVQFIFRNPHSFVHVQTVDESGAPQRWAVEWSGVSQLGNQGLSRESLKVGDEVVIVGRPSRVSGEYRALMVSLKRPSDGFTWGSKTGEAVD